MKRQRKGRRNRNPIMQRRRCRLEQLEKRQLLAADVLFADSFESGINSNDWNSAWVEDSQNDWFRSTQRSTDGSVSAEVDGPANNATLEMSNAVDLTGYDSAELTFDWLIERRFDRGEYLAVDVSDDGGASWSTGIRQLNGNSDPENQWRSESIDLSPYASAEVLVRFRAKVSRSNEDANVDNVKITGELSQPSVSIGDTIVTEGDAATSQFLNAFVTSGSGGLGDPRAFELGPDGNLYVTSLGTNSVLRYNGVSGAFLDEFVAPGSGGLDRPRDLVFDSNGNLLVLSGQNNQIIRYSGGDGSFDAVLIDGTDGLDRPQNATYLDATNELLISSARTDEILKYDASTGDFLGTFVSAGDGGLDNPKWQLLTDSGELLVVSQLGDQILKYSAAGAFQEVLYSVPASQASTTILMGLAWGTDGSLLVAEDNDVHAGRVIRLDADSGAFLSEYVPIGSGGLDSPRGIMTDGDGNLYVASYNTDEILRYSPVSSASFTVSLSAASDQPVTVDYATDDGNATAGNDYDATSGTLVFAPGETSQSISVPIIDDAMPEATESFTVNLSNASGAILADSEGLGQIIDDGDPANLPPVSDDDGYSLAEDSILSVATPGVLDGDSDPEGDALTATLIANASHGVVTLNTDGSFTYTPNPDFSGSDSFTYVANDGTSDSNVATVNLTVTPVNDAPDAQADNFAVDQETALSVPADGVLGNDGDVDGDSLSAVPWSGGSVQGGQVVLNSDGSFSYTPPVGFSGIDSFDYSASDGGLESALATVTIDVTEANQNVIYVADIRFESEQVWWWTRQTAIFEIRTDSNGDGQGGGADDVAAGVAITVEFNGNRYSGVTQSDGTFRVGLWASSASAEVVDLALADYQWNPMLDLPGDSDGDGLPDASL